MSKKNNLYLGRAGEFAVISEFLCRGWNVAIPEVDAGDDVFVVRDSDGEFRRVQVKTANGTQVQHGVKAQFNLLADQVRTDVNPELVYAFVVRWDSRWLPFVIIPRIELLGILEQKLGGLPGSKHLNISIVHQETNCSSGKLDLTPYINNFEKFPTIFH